MTGTIRHPDRLITSHELPLWVPGQILCCSEPLGWQDIAQRTYRYHGQDVEIPPLDAFMIVRYRHGSTPMDRQFDGRWTRTRCHPGHFSLLSRSAESHWHWTSDVVVSHLYLTNELMSRVASDMFDEAVDAVELHDVLRGSDPLVNRIVDDVTREATQRTSGSSLYVQALAVQLAVHLIRHYASCRRCKPAPRGSLSVLQVSTLEDYVDTHLHESISLHDMAALLELGVWTFSRRVQQTFGCTPHALVVQRRVHRASHLLRSTNVPLKQIAAMCGFSDQAHMTRTLRQHLGATPGALRKAR